METILVRCKYYIGAKNEIGCYVKDCCILQTKKNMDLILGNICDDVFKQSKPFNANMFSVGWTTYLINKKHLIEVKDE